MRMKDLPGRKVSLCWDEEDTNPAASEDVKGIILARIKDHPNGITTEDLAPLVGLTPRQLQTPLTTLSERKLIRIADKLPPKAGRSGKPRNLWALVRKD